MPKRILYELISAPNGELMELFACERGQISLEKALGLVLMS
jgi:hypothetical protein